MLALAATLAFGVVNVTPSDDVWVYPHSSSPGSENFLRVWGDGSSAIDPTFANDGGFSYAFLQWPSKDLKEGAPAKATLTVYAVAPDELTEAKIKEAPLQAFALNAAFKEDGFMGMQTEVKPVGDSVGKATAEKKGDKWVLMIELNESYRTAIGKAQAEKKPFGIALGSSMSVAESRANLYKVYSKENPEDVRPSLALEYAD